MLAQKSGGRKKRLPTLGLKKFVVQGDSFFRGFVLDTAGGFVLQGIRAPGFFSPLPIFPKKNVETGNPGEWCAKQFSLGFLRFSFHDTYTVLQVFF